MEFSNYSFRGAKMSDPSKCLTLGGPPDVHANDVPSRADSEQLSGGRRLSETTVRLIENWIVGVVTVLSAGVILVTLLAHHDGTATSSPSGQVTIDAGSVRR